MSRITTPVALPHDRLTGLDARLVDLVPAPVLGDVAWAFSDATPGLVADRVLLIFQRAFPLGRAISIGTVKPGGALPVREAQGLRAGDLRLAMEWVFDLA
jgi:hypothetical protein